MRKLPIVLAAGALAAPALAVISGSISSSLGTVDFNSDTSGTVEEQADGSLHWSGQQTWTSIQLSLTWDYVVDGDPFINGVAGFTNLQANPTNISFDLSLNSDATIAAPSVYGASTITVTDVGGGGATMSALAGDSIYRAFILGNTQKTLFDDPYALNAGLVLPGFDGAGWGPQPAVGGINLGDLFGIDHDFRLTGGGDQATVNSTFFIVPEPASLALLMVGGLVLRRR